MRTIQTLATICGALTLSLSAMADGDIKHFVCEKLDDFTATATVVKANTRELEKISKDFGMAYRFKDVNFLYKEPNMARMEASSQGTKLTFIVSGSRQIVSLNGRKLSDQTWQGSPGKKKSLMDVGLVSDFYLTYTTAKYLREGTVEGTPVSVFDMSYKNKDEDSSHHIIYIDPKTKVVRKRESYSQAGKLQALFFFNKVEQIKPGIWMPTEIEVQTTDRVVAGVTAYKNIKVNTGLADSVFKP